MTRPWMVHASGGCEECDFDPNHHEGRADMSNIPKRVYRHARKTGHRCWVETGYAQRYNFKEDEP